MAKILVLTETSGNNPKPVTLEILGKLSGQHIEVASLGELNSEAIEQLAKYGASKVHSLKGENLSIYSPEGYSQAYSEFLKSNSYDYVFAGATSQGKDLIPRLAGHLDAGMASEVTNFVIENDTFHGTRPLFASPDISAACLARTIILTNGEPTPVSSGAPSSFRSNINVSGLGI